MTLSEIMELTAENIETELEGMLDEPCIPYLRMNMSHIILGDGIMVFILTHPSNTTRIAYTSDYQIHVTGENHSIVRNVTNPKARQRIRDLVTMVKLRVIVPELEH